MHVIFPKNELRISLHQKVCFVFFFLSLNRANDIKKEMISEKGVYGRGDERLGLNGGEEGERETGLPSLIETSRKQNERITLTCLVKHERGSLHDKCNKCLIKMAWTLYLGLVPPTTI